MMCLQVGQLKELVLSFSKNHISKHSKWNMWFSAQGSCIIEQVKEKFAMQIVQVSVCYAFREASLNKSICRFI